MFDGSLLKLFQNIYPNHVWLPWKFTEQSVPKGYWSNHQNQYLYLDWLGSILGFQQMDDWYQGTSKTIIEEHGGQQLLKLFGTSPSNLLTSIYTEYPWMLWRFNVVPHGFWTHFTATNNLNEIHNLLNG